MDKSVMGIDVDYANKQLALKSKQYGKAILTAILIVAFIAAAVDIAEATTTGAGNREFDDAANKFESWIKGNLGKAISFVALMFGAAFAAVKKDGTYFVFAIFVAIGIQIIVGIINSSFTALV